MVQGVGFRPYVYHLAVRCGLNGFVRNQAGVVHIEVEGELAALERFCSELAASPPPLAAIGRISCVRLDLRGDSDFRIEASGLDSAAEIVISPDIATCGDCLAELFDPADRRYRYPFVNCTHCGPRLTIVRGAPYDRQRTTMAGFRMCAECRAEYENPSDRRFHAQPVCCPRCGPRLALRSRDGQPLDSHDPLRDFARALLDGQIGALKGLGGYHLACDASNNMAVGQLRRRKGREEKPLAIMVASLAAARAFCEISSAEGRLLESPRAPIVLLRRRQDRAASGRRGSIADSVAPGNPYLGVLLPYTPLHHLLVQAVGDVPLVMTSGNRTDEPIAYRDEQAFAQLGDIADVFLTHNRPIEVRCDDSVTRVVGKTEYPIRRSRGDAPRPVALPMECPRPILAVGGQLKGTFALGQSRLAYCSHHLGDLDDYEAYAAFQRDVRRYEELFAVAPQVIVHDLHPDYATTRYALDRAEREAIRTLGVQHHHAHVTSCMAEHGLRGEVLGVALDGTGYGSDGAIWGGEFLLAGYSGFLRLAHLRYVPLPGGDQAIREPWRSAASHLVDAGGELGLLDWLAPAGAVRVVRRMIERRINSPATSSAGRLFDAVAALAGVRGKVSFEAQAALELEWLATGTPPAGSYPFAIEPPTEAVSPQPCQVDTRPLIRAVANDARRGTDRAKIARRFHTTLVEVIAAVCDRLRRDTGRNRVVLSGGVFMNTLLIQETATRLRADGFRVYRQRVVPPNDAGLSLGQLAAAAEMMRLASEAEGREAAGQPRAASIQAAAGAIGDNGRKVPARQPHDRLVRT